MYHSTRIGRYARSISMQRWSLSSSTISSSELSDRFLMATKLVASIPRTPSNEEKLELYALYKQACKGEAIENFETSVFDFVGKAKHEAWSKKRGMSKVKAQEEYIKMVETLLGKPVSSDPEDTKCNKDSSSKHELFKMAYANRLQNMIGTFEGKAMNIECNDEGIVKVLLNRPKRGNAFDIDTWIEFKRCFELIHQDEASKVVILTGGSKTFSTGMVKSNTSVYTFV